MDRVAYGNMQFICRYYPQLWITILPPELVTDRCNRDRVAGRRCFLNNGDHPRGRHEQSNDDENRNNSQRQFDLIAAAYLGRFASIVGSFSFLNFTTE